MTSIAIEPSEDLRARIPPQYRLAGPQHVETKSASESAPEFTDILRTLLPRPIPIWIIQGQGAAKLRAVKAIAAKLRFEDGYYFAGNDSLAVYGTGLTVQEAIADFCVHIFHFYQYYRALQPDQLIGEAILLKNLFSETFIEE